MSRLAHGVAAYLFCLFLESQSVYLIIPEHMSSVIVSYHALSDVTRYSVSYLFFGFNLLTFLLISPLSLPGPVHVKRIY